MYQYLLEGRMRGCLPYKKHLNTCCFRHDGCYLLALIEDEIIVIKSVCSSEIEYLVR